MIYKIALFLHIIGALMVCAALAIEWVCLLHMKKANEVSRIEDSIFYYTRLGKVGDIGAALILFPGIYMMVGVWGDAPWAIAGVIGLFLIGIIGGMLTKRKMQKVAAMLKEQNRSVHSLAIIFHDNTLSLSLNLRTFILAGVIFLMTIKTAIVGSGVTLMICVIAALLVSAMKRKTFTEKSPLSR